MSERWPSEPTKLDELEGEDEQDEELLRLDLGRSTGWRRTRWTRSLAYLARGFALA